MRKALDISRLTRPARIRCRPSLFLRNGSLSSSASQSKPSDAPVKVSDVKEKGVEKPLVPAFGARRAEMEDYILAMEMAKLEDGYDQPRVRKIRKSKLPSLHDPQSFLWDSKQASSSKVTSSASPTLQPSRKGKEKEVVANEYETSEPNQEVQTLEDAKPIDSEGRKSSPRRNPVGVQMLSPSLHSQLFPGQPLPKPPQALLDISKSHLKDNDLFPEGAAVLPEISFDLPSLRGNNIRDHFHALGQYTAEPHASMARKFAATRLPAKPDRWEMGRSGWTKYYSDGRMEAVDDLGDETLVSFDVEVLYKLSRFPVMATAVTPNAWYSWLSPVIFQSPPAEIPEPPPPWEASTPTYHPHELIPLFNNKSSIPRIVIGHNVGYDRARVKEEYSLERTQTRWLDTLSLHVSTRGITSVQRPAWMAYKKNKKAKKLREQENLSILQEMAEKSGDDTIMDSLQEFGAASETEEAEALQSRWEDVTSMNSLAEVAALHCGYPVDKSVRDRFGDDSIKHASQIHSELHQLLSYCADDVRVTHDVYAKVFPLFLESCPHPATLSGVLSMGSSFLPVDQSWKEYLRNAEETYREMDVAVKKALRLLAEKLRAEGEPKEGDPWASQLDWSPKNARWSDEDLEATGKHSVQPQESAQPHKPGFNSGASSPTWLTQISSNHSILKSNMSQRYLLPLLLRMSFKGHPVAYLSEHGWCFMVPHDQVGDYFDTHGSPHMLSAKDNRLEKLEESYSFFRIGNAGSPKKTKLVGPSIKPFVKSGDLTSAYPELLIKVMKTDLSDAVEDLWECVVDIGNLKESEWGQQLDWTPATEGSASSNDVPLSSSSSSLRPSSIKKSKTNHGTWPKWYWDLTGPVSRLPVGELDLTCKKTIAPLLLRLQWQGFPLVHSKEHKWLYRLPRKVYEEEDERIAKARGLPVSFREEGPDAVFAKDDDHVYFRLPHKDGEGKNVGNPLSKGFVKAIESGELASAAAESGDDVAAKAAADATNMNAFCSYWISSRERIMDQMVVYRDQEFGMILPQVITMGTVTRRAVEATWLTASNAKKNRVGSELKAMVRAPPGYSIVGSDVDSEELWISSVMGDSQFGMHGATAIGWMTLEGNKSAGTDLHSKTASILGISRDAAKVFNYSRIYGAGKKHAVQLLLQGDSKLTKETAGKLADNLYKSTKGAKALRARNLPVASVPSLWHGGSESYLFNTLEAIALSDRPTTPALGCGVTRALRKSYLEESASYLPSRVNWVVQSSGVDYLHLLIVSMEYLIKKYDIKARYLISVHDEVRYLAKEEDRYRTALALQVANAWTRALFCFNLGIDDMPQGITFFSAVDIDHVLRKEVFLTCETPSHPKVIPAGESLDINSLLEKVPRGDLGTPIPDDLQPPTDIKPPVALFPNIQSAQHRQFLQAQASKGGMGAKKWLDNLPPVQYIDEVNEENGKPYQKSHKKAVLSSSKKPRW